MPEVTSFNRWLSRSKCMKEEDSFAHDTTQGVFGYHIKNISCQFQQFDSWNKKI